MLVGTSCLSICVPGYGDVSDALCSSPSAIFAFGDTAAAHRADCPAAAAPAAAAPAFAAN